MGDHYHRIDNDVPRPKILGLTASPIFNLKNPQKALTDIERLTACRVVIVKQNVAQLAAHTYQARDRIVDYAATLSVFPTYPRPSLWQDLHAKDILPNDLLFPPKRRSGELPQNEWYTSFQGRYASTLLSLGPFAADVFVFVHMTSSLDRVKDELVPLYPGHEDPHAERRAAMTAACEVMKAHQSRLVSDGGEIRHEWMTPKLIALKELLREQRDVPNFRGIIFTHERQIATTISLIFPRLGVPGINAGPLVGHGQNACSEPMKIGMKGMAFHAQEKILQDFRDGSLNLLIATSVAEEGLDFPLCSFVCRYDPPRTLPQYIQSRGRARKENSTFVIMLEKGPSLDRVRVQSLQLGEEKVKKMYGNRMDSPDDSVEDDFVEDDYFEGCFTVEKTGASITPAGCISLLENLCSLIPVDLHTQPLHPKYTISGGTPYADFEAHVLLPAALPIDRSNLLIKGGIGSQTKKAAKRSAAFNAVVMLYRLGVFDDYLLPIRREKGDVAEDIDGKPPIDVTGIEPMMEVMVHDAWGDVRGEDTQMFVHQLSISEKTGMGLVSAVRLAEFEGDMMATGQKTRVHVAEGVPVVIEKDKKASSIEQMETFTKTGIYHSITRKGLQNKQLSFFLVPLDANGLPDWGAIERSNNAPASRDWCGVDMSGKTELLVLLLNNSKVSRLIGVRSDLTIKDCAESDSYVSKLITHAKKRGESIPEDDVILECREILQTKSTEFRDPSRQKKGILSEKSVFLPLSQCQWAKFDLHQIAWFQLLPPLAHLISSVHRARAVQHMLEASLSIDRIIEAFTLPSASASFSNQRLETLGDAFLKLATSIHVYNKFPYKHEGQLTVLKENSVSNRYLLGRGHIRSLTSYMTVEPNSHTRWRLTTDNTRLVNGEWMVSRKIPRRSVQDCMEATLGAAWLSGGVKAALAVGTNLGLCFGGKQAWWERKEYEQNSMEISTGSPFPVLEATLGYTFKDKMLLLEALTHPSFAKGGPSYQRLEFLGDGMCKRHQASSMTDAILAVLDLVVLDHFFNNYPNAGPGKLSRARARCVCSPTLAAIATKKLGIPKQIFCDSVSLVQAMMEKSAQFDTMSFPQIIDSIWSLDAPKALSDVVEALLGAIFVDCGWRYDVVAEVIKRLLEDVLAYVHTEMPADPASEFMIWVARYGCTQVKYRCECCLTILYII